MSVAYVSTCPNCGANVDVPETTGWAPLDDPEDHGDGGWSRDVTCSSCNKVFLVHWIGNLPDVVSETFYQTVNIGKGKVKTIRMRFLLGRPPSSSDAPTGLNNRQISRLLRKGGSFEDMRQALRDKALGTCAAQIGISMTLAEKLEKGPIIPK